MLETKENRVVTADNVDVTDLCSIINFPEIQEMMNSFYVLTGIGMSITDMGGNILVATGWQDICTKFHRCQPEALKNCIESDTYITRNPVKGKYTIYKCKNNIWDLATPLYVGGKHAANLFMGQFFFDDEVPDYELFREQAKKYGFDEAGYLSALDRVPRWNREKVHAAMEFYTRLAGMINNLSYTNVLLHDMLRKQKEAEKELSLAKTQAELYLDLMGHDINNINMIVQGNLELAREHLPVESTQAEFLDKSIEVLRRSTRIIENVRTLQKLNDSKSLAGRVDICQVLREVRREYDSVSGKTICLNLQGHQNCIVLADDQIHDVFGNLVSNAVRHTRYQTGIEIDLNSIEAKVHGYYQVSIADNGPGVPDELKVKIFNRMLHCTDKSKGLGLGLYIVKSLVESYGGQVWVEDRVPGDHAMGARFMVLLPAA